MSDSITLCRQCLQTECHCEGNKNEKDDSTAAVRVRAAADNNTVETTLVTEKLTLVAAGCEQLLKDVA